jgi:hypothetical protein
VNFLSESGGKKDAASVQKTLAQAGFAFTSQEVKEAQQQRAELVALCGWLSRVDKVIRTAKLDGRTPFIMIGEGHFVTEYYNLQTCLMYVIARNDVMAFFPECGKRQFSVAFETADTCSKVSIDSCYTACVAYNALLGSQDFCIPVDKDELIKDRKYAYERSEYMTDKTVDYLSKARAEGKAERKVAAGIFGAGHLRHFREDAIWNKLTKVCVPINVDFFAVESAGNMSIEYLKVKCPKHFEDLSIFDMMVRCPWPVDDVAFAKAFDPSRVSKNCSDAEMVRGFENAEPFTCVLMKARQTRFKDLAAWERQDKEIVNSWNDSFATTWFTWGNVITKRELR